MATQALLMFPDARLRIRAEPIAGDDATLPGLARDVLDTLRQVGAIGLTAVHIGRPKRLVVIRMQPDAPHLVYVNPEIVWASPERSARMEGSVSMPGISEPVERAARIRVAFVDLDGGRHEGEAEGFHAACLQHEIDQLDGIFWTDRLSRLRRDRALKRFNKIGRTVP